jgi:hypothetical protein
MLAPLSDWDLSTARGAMPRIDVANCAIAE